MVLSRETLVCCVSVTHVGVRAHAQVSTRQASKQADKAGDGVRLKYRQKHFGFGGCVAQAQSPTPENYQSRGSGVHLEDGITQVFGSKGVQPPTKAKHASYCLSDQDDFGRETNSRRKKDFSESFGETGEEAPTATDDSPQTTSFVAMFHAARAFM